MRTKISLLLIAVVVMSLLAVSPAQAQTHFFTIDTGNNGGGCSMGGPTETFGIQLSYTWPDAPLDVTATVIGGVAGLSGSSSNQYPQGTGLINNRSFTFNSVATPSPWSFTVQLVGYAAGVAKYQAVISISCSAGGTDYTTALVSGGSVEPAFGGPGLPAGSNLVLVLAETGVLTEAGGSQTGLTIKACKTVFITQTSTDGRYGHAFVQGGWIDLNNTIDVGETYGQPGGDPIYPPCVGK